MSKLERGKRRICQACGTKYYDMNREPVTCPACSAAYQPDFGVRSRRPAPSAGRSEAASATVPEPVVEADAETKVKADDAAVDAAGGDDPGKVENGEAASLPDDEDEEENLLPEADDDDDLSDVVGEVSAGET